MVLLKSGEPNIGEAMQASKMGHGLDGQKTVTDYINTDRGLLFVNIGRPLNLEKLGDTSL